MNSLVVALAVTGLQLVTCSMAAYAFARLRFKGRDTLFLGYLGTLMIPAQVVLIPNFIVLRQLGWIDTYQALILPAAFSAFGTFLLRQYFLTIPRELEDAAVVDGANHWQIYLRVIMPLSGPALSALAIFAFLSNWNSFLYPLIVTTRVNMSTLTVGLNTLQGQYNTAWTLLMAGSVIALVPILLVFIFAQRYFIAGVTMTGLGGRCSAVPASAAALVAGSCASGAGGSRLHGQSTVGRSISNTFPSSLYSLRPSLATGWSAAAFTSPSGPSTASSA